MVKNLKRKTFSNKNKTCVYERITTIKEPIFIGIKESCIFEIAEEIFKGHKLNRLVYLSPTTNKWYSIEQRMNNFLFTNVDPNHICFHIPIKKERK